MTNDLISRIRRRLGRLRRTRMMVRAVDKRVVSHDKRLAAQSKQLDQLNATAQRQAKQLRDLSKAFGDLKVRIGPFDKASSLRQLEHGRFSYQIGSMEERLAGIEQRIGDGTFVADDAEAAEARSLVEEVRREHEQVRVRMQIVSAYEERLRRVEASVEQLYDGDRRHPV
jgi:chromosome segregation ATPase